MVNVNIDARKNQSDESPITQEQRDKIQKASDEAYKMVKKGYNVICRIRDLPRARRQRTWRNTPEVKRWFGTDHLSKYQINQVSNRLGRLKENLEGTVRFTIIQHQDGTRSWLCHDGVDPNIGYCSLGSSIKLCPSFFYDNITNERERAMTVVHELCHHVGLIDRRVEGNKVYGRGPAKDLAINDPREARKNPSNIAYFCDEYRTITGTGGPPSDPYGFILMQLVDRFKGMYPYAQFSEHFRENMVCLQLGSHQVEEIHFEWLIYKLWQAGVFERKLHVGLHLGNHIYINTRSEIFDLLVSNSEELHALLETDVEFGYVTQTHEFFELEKGLWIEYSIDSLEDSDVESLINWGVKSMIKLYDFMHRLCLKCGAHYEFHPPDTLHTILYFNPEGPINFIETTVICGTCGESIKIYWRKRESSVMLLIQWFVRALLTLRRNIAALVKPKARVVTAKIDAPSRT